VKNNSSISSTCESHVYKAIDHSLCTLKLQLQIQPLKYMHIYYYMYITYMYITKLHIALYRYTKVFMV